MDVYPPNAATVQVSIADELHHLTMRDGARLVYTLIYRQKLPPACAFTHEQLSIYEGVPRHLIDGEQSIQLSRVGRPASKEPDPDRSINQNHQAILRLAFAFSRRLGISCAWGSVPRRARRRS